MINRDQLNSFKNLKDSIKQAKDLCLGDFFNCWDAPNDDALMNVNSDWIEDVKKEEDVYPEWQEVKKIDIKKIEDELLYDPFAQSLFAKIELVSGRTITVYALDEFNIKTHNVQELY